MPSLMVDQLVQHVAVARASPTCPVRTRASPTTVLHDRGTSARIGLVSMGASDPPLAMLSTLGD